MLVSVPVKGMGIIEQLDPPSFSNYIKKYRNTICGRHPIGVLLNVSASAVENDKLAPFCESALAPERFHDGGDSELGHKKKDLTSGNSRLNRRVQRSSMNGSFGTRVNISRPG